ncbi:riboflavin biosynthesis protein RibF [Asticcacaulis sp. YBE204]|uniref:riboflavin biosynthesis protein RibF n=1 Tax=Asticcacaulis sp. YBE204 TaxID=1282363 RepID=UPI0003C40F1D|nr:riboflavin biosynthesis protein RibF [Asticcacaulis sp. YBE204]ESQ78006.1 riboflavin biosynthesis protein RibF [Asticcacaulis sp. YBE204]
MLKAFNLAVDADGSLRTTALNAAAEGLPLPVRASAALGSFDGVHRGHQRVIENAIAAAHRLGEASAVICFDPHPQTYFLSRTGEAVTPFRLMSLAQQLHAFEALGVEYALVLRFDEHLSALTAEAFARIILKDHLNLSHVSCGFDFRFGAKGTGTAEALAAFGETMDFTTFITPCQSDETGHKLSSSAVRDALDSGNPQLAGHVLGRAQAFEGVVTRGDQIGRQIGFPTANIELGDYLRPKYGVYVTRTHLADGRVLGSVTNFGKRPTVGGLSERFETNIFGLDHEIYDQTIEVELLHYIRPEHKFPSFEALKEQIAKDAETAKAYFS